MHQVQHMQERFYYHLQKVAFEEFGEHLCCYLCATIHVHSYLLKIVTPAHYMGEAPMGNNAPITVKVYPVCSFQTPNVAHGCLSHILCYITYQLLQNTVCDCSY